jgi:uncharacterized protein
MRFRTRLLAGAVAGTLALGLLAGPALGQNAAEPPADFIAAKDTLSQPTFPKTVTEKTRVTLFDGETMYVEVTRPDPAVYGEQKLPVILEASPYHGANGTRIGDRVFSDPVGPDGKKLGLTGYFAPRGYAVVMADLRGTGRSTGCLDHLGPKDAKDLKTIVEWSASQAWSNGKVGMAGHSYVGATQIVALAQRPKGLATIVPSAGLASMYDHQFQKGVPYNLQWVGPMVAYEWLAAIRDLPPGINNAPVLGGSSGDNFGSGPNAQTGCGATQSAALAGPGEVTGEYELWHAQRDWRQAAADADIPVFMVHGVNDNAARIPAAEWFFTERYGRPGDKVWLGQWDHGGSTNTRCGDANSVRTAHVTCRFAQWQYALHAWFDKHLKGMDVDTGPAVEVFLNGEEAANVFAVADPEQVNGKVVTADAWERATTFSNLYLDASDNSLDTTPPTTAASKSFSSAADAVLASAGDGKLTFTSQPVAQDTVFLGMPRMNLNASIAQAFAHLSVTLWRVDESGGRELMNVCAIQPQLRNGIHNVAPVVPGQEMELPMQCFTMAHWVPAGNTLVAEVATGISQHHATFGSVPQVTVYTGPGKSTYELPVAVGAVLQDDVPLREAK